MLAWKGCGRPGLTTGHAGCSSASLPVSAKLASTVEARPR